MPIAEKDRPVCPLVGEDGNAFSIIGRVRKTLIKAGFKKEADDFQREATAGDYNNLLMVACSYVREPDEDLSDDDEDLDEDEDFDYDEEDD